jgi:hypothetical protein
VASNKAKIIPTPDVAIYDIQFSVAYPELYFHFPDPTSGFLAVGMY